MDNHQRKFEIVPSQINIVMTTLFVVNKHVAYKELVQHLVSGEIVSFDVLRERIVKFMDKHNNKSLTTFFKPISITKLVEYKEQTLSKDERYHAELNAVFYGYDNVHRIHPVLKYCKGEQNKTNTTKYFGIECVVEDLPKIILGSDIIQASIAVVYFGRPPEIIFERVEIPNVRVVELVGHT
jgi:hypothetical protein